MQISPPRPGDRVTVGVATASVSRRLLIAGGFAALIVLCGVSVFVGSGRFSPDVVWDALFSSDSSDMAVVLVREFRLPRTLLAVLVGLALAVSGVIMQALTRNPLADPGILGVNAGAFAAVVFAAAVLGTTTAGALVWVAMGGALLTSALVFLIGATGFAAGSSSKLILSGVALGAVFSAVSLTMMLSNTAVFERLRYWQLGSLENRQADVVVTVVGFVLVGTLLGLGLGRGLNLIALGEETASALGVRIAVIRLLGVAAVTMLCGAATAAAGPVAFVGLMVPHAVRVFVGSDQRRVLLASALAGPSVFLAADALSRIIAPAEFPVGIVMAVVGGPVLIVLTRRRSVAL